MVGIFFEERDEVTHPIEVRRLAADELSLARKTFHLMTEVFGELPEALSDDYLAALLARDAFWSYVALRDGVPIGGVTAHSLAMTRGEAMELFIYDLAVHPDHQRRGVGRALVSTLIADAAEQGILVVFVAADNDDVHALEFYRALGGGAAPVTVFTFE